MFKLVVDKLAKSFGERKVLKDLSFELPAPGSLGITGRNGSGKTTLIKILAQTIHPSKGRVAFLIGDKPMSSEQVLDHLKVVGPEMALYEMLTAYENLKFFSTLTGKPLARAEQDALLTRVGLEGRGADMVSGYSSGMKQRLKYAVALLGEPEILLLDEPTANLDESGKAIVARIIAEQKKSKIVIIATNEIEDLRHVERTIRLD